MNMTVPLSNETTTMSRPAKSRSISRPSSAMRLASILSVMSTLATSARASAAAQGSGRGEERGGFVHIWMLLVGLRLPRGFASNLPPEARAGFFSVAFGQQPFERLRLDVKDLPPGRHSWQRRPQILPDR